jgi:hypothetical protein
MLSTMPSLAPAAFEVAIQKSDEYVGSMHPDSGGQLFVMAPCLQVCKSRSSELDLHIAV